MEDAGRIVILGAGPTGLGAAHRLNELGYDKYMVYEAEGHVGGLAASFRDRQGFYWDVGGHVLFSHYKYFDDLMEKVVPKDGWVSHERESWIWIKDRFVPYPFQNNVKFLPRRELWDCVSGLMDAWDGRGGGTAPSNFRDWILASFGKGIAGHFLLPYNTKVWAYPPEELTYTWIGERVSTPDLRRVISNVILDKDDASWGPNNKFRFPLYGGSGSIWKNLAGTLPRGRVALRHRAVSIDLGRRVVEFSNGKKAGYDKLITTIPLNIMGGVCRGMGAGLRRDLAALKHSSVHVVGIGIEGRVPEKLKTKCWMYFPEGDNPFYRVTVFSNYSPYNVPDIKRQWSLMAEVAESPASPKNPKDVVREVIRGFHNTRLIGKNARIVSTWKLRSKYDKPTPFIGRDEAVNPALDYLKSRGVYSRGRFGAWKYEVSNMDHSVMQGVELVNHLLQGEEELTLPYPSRVNSPGKK